MGDESESARVRPRVYIDTSVVSALLDTARPDRLELTKVFWGRTQEFEAVTADLTRDELAGTPDPARRRDLLALLAMVSVHSTSVAMFELAREYVARAIVPRRYEADAIHVAAAVHLHCPILVSWNFRHLVNRRRRAAVNAANRALGLPRLDIISPAEF